MSQSPIRERIIGHALYLFAVHEAEGQEHN